MKKILFGTLLLLLSSCSNNNNTFPAPVSLNINKAEIEYMAVIEDIQDSSNGAGGTFRTRHWVFHCAGTTPQASSSMSIPGYVYIANNEGNYGGHQLNKIVGAITLSLDTNPSPLQPPQMIYVESINQIDLPYIISCCVSGTIVPRPGMYIRISYKNTEGTIYRDIGTKVFPNIKSVALSSGQFSF